MTYLPETRRQLLAAAERRAGRRELSLPRLRLGWVIPALSLVVAVAVAIAFLGLRTQPGRAPATAHSHRLQLVYVAAPTLGLPVITHAALELTVKQMGLRLTEIPHSNSSIQILSGNRIRVDVTTRASRHQVESLVGSDARLLFYDWEGSVLLGNGKTAANQHREAPAPLGLYQAVKLASRQPYTRSTDNSRVGSEYYLFSPGGARLWAGPLDVAPNVSHIEAVRELKAGLPRTERRQGRILVVKQGTVVVEAAPKLFRVAQGFGNPNAGYYVLRDNVAVFGNEITHPRAGTTQAGAPDVQFGFTPHGAAAFHWLTVALARRGERESTGSRMLDQHFAVALDNQLITVPEIEYQVYPAGVTASSSDLTGRFNRSSARALAKALQLGALPVKLQLVR